MMTDSVRAATILAGDREVYRQKSLNRSGESARMAVRTFIVMPPVCPAMG